MFNLTYFTHLLTNWRHQAATSFILPTGQLAIIIIIIIIDLVASTQLLESTCTIKFLSLSLSIESILF